MATEGFLVRRSEVATLAPRYDSLKALLTTPERIDYYPVAAIIATGDTPGPRFLRENPIVSSLDLEKLQLSFRLIDHMENLSLDEKLVYIVQATRYMLAEKEPVLPEQEISRILKQNIFGISDLLLREANELTQTNPIHKERFGRFRKWVDRVYKLKQTKQDILDIEKDYDEFDHWLYEILTDESKNRLLWKELGNFIPNIFKKPGETALNRGNRMWRNAIKLEKLGLIDPKFIDRVSLKNTSYYNEILCYALLPGNQNRRISFSELGKLLGIERKATVQSIVERMKNEGIPVPSNIGERSGPGQEMDEKIRTTQGVIDRLVVQNNGKTPPNSLIQAELDRMGRHDINIDVLTTGKYKKLLHFPERRKSVTSQDIIDIKGYQLQGKTVQEIQSITGFSEGTIRKVLSNKHP